jgi:7-cyano-7-deazaguanine synthase
MEQTDQTLNSGDSAILLSGGMDSSGLAYLHRPKTGVFINYGQRAAEAEHRAATAIASELSMPLEVIQTDLSSLGTGVMAGAGQISAGSSPEWWPDRNQLLITLCAMRVISLGLKHILIGTVATDRLHGDNSIEFMTAMNSLLLTQEGALSLSAPARGLTTVELVRKAEMPMSAVAWTHSCHISIFPCGRCRGCIKRQLALEELARPSL